MAEDCGAAVRQEEKFGVFQILVAPEPVRMGRPGAGGVDFPAIFRILRDRKFRGWVVLDLDAPRPGDGTGSIQQNLAANIEYLRDKVGNRFPKVAA